jgi:hypothetical protein
MSLRTVGAGLPCTATSSLRLVLEQLLGERCYHMNVIPGHPFVLGSGWNRALAGETSDWDELFAGYVAAVDWPASLFWREPSAAYPDVLMLLSVRDSAEEWWHSADETILPYARMSLAPNWSDRRGFLDLLEHFSSSLLCLCQTPIP